MASNLAAVLLSLMLVSQCCSQRSSDSSTDTCPPGFVPANTSQGPSPCICSHVWMESDIHDMVKCQSNSSAQQLTLTVGHCMTYDESEEVFFLGACPYNLKYRDLVLPQNLSELESVMCKSFNRRGRLCEECLEGYGVSIARSMHCKKCESTTLEMLKYLSMQVLPSTVIFLAIMVFNIKLSKSPLNAFVLYSQVAFSIMYYDPKLHQLGHYYNIKDKFVLKLIHIFKATCGILCLDFHVLFHYTSHICFRRPSKGVHILMLKYVEAFYPLAMLLVVYLCVHLHQRNFKPLVLVGRLASRVLTLLSPQDSVGVNPSERIANGLVAFFSLTHTKLLFTSLNLLIPNQIDEINGTTSVHHRALYFDPTLEYFGKEHIPYVVVALVVLSLFVALPILILTLTPLRPVTACFRLVLRSKWHAMHYFLEIFQGWFKTGEDGSFDFRFIAAVFPILKCLLGVWVLVLTGLIYRTRNIWLIPSMLFQGIGLFFAIFRPYRREAMNMYDSLLLSLIGTIAAILCGLGGAVLYIVMVLVYLPLIVAALYSLYRLHRWVVNGICSLNFYRKFKLWRCFSCCSCFGDTAYPPLLPRHLHNVGQDDTEINHA